MAHPDISARFYVRTNPIFIGRTSSLHLITSIDPLTLINTESCHVWSNLTLMNLKLNVSCF